MPWREYFAGGLPDIGKTGRQQGSKVNGWIGEANHCFAAANAHKGKELGIALPEPFDELVERSLPPQAARGFAY